MSAPGQDAAQSAGTAPDGQGQDQDRSFSSILGEDAFSSAPPELRDHLAEYVRTQVDPKLTQRFQEHAEFRNTWEPFSQIEGLTNLHPEDVDQLVELGYVMAAAGDENHPNRQQALEQLSETWEQIGDQFGLFDDEEGEEGDEGEDDEPQYMTREEFEQAQREQQQQQQLQQTTAQTAQEIRGHVDGLDLPGEPGSKERKAAEDAVYSFIYAKYGDGNMSNEEAVQAAFADYQAIAGAGQRQLLEEHEEPGESVRGGRSDNAPEKIGSWADADRAAKARMAGAR